MKLVKSCHSPSQVSIDLELTETALRAWVKQSDVDAGVGIPEIFSTRGAC